MNTRILLVVTLAGALMLSACSNTDGATVQNLRAAAGIPATATTEPATLTPQPTETPDLQPEAITAPATLRQAQDIAAAPVIIEVTREVVDVQQVETTRIVIVTATPEPAPTAGVDESPQPCPAKYWRRNRCTATQAQIEQAASEVQP